MVEKNVKTPPKESPKLREPIQIRKAAAAALKTELAKQALQHQHDERYHNYLVREALARLMGYAKCEDDVGVGRGLHLEVDGLLFAHPDKCSNGGQYDLRLVYVCEKCKAELFSVRVVNLAHLGRMLESPEIDPKSAKTKCDNAERHQPRPPTSPPKVRSAPRRNLQIE